MVYSSTNDVLVDFTRDYETIRQALHNIDHYDKVCIEGVLQASASLLQTKWSSQNYNQVVVFTRCGVGLGSTSLPNIILKLTARKALQDAAPSLNSPSTAQKFLANESNDDWSQLSNLSKLSVVCLDWYSSTYFKQAIDLYQKLLDMICPNGQLFVPNRDELDKLIRNSYNNDVASTFPTPTQWKSEVIPQLMKSICDTNYKSFEATLSSGGYFRLDAKIILWPAPMPFSGDDDMPKMISRKLAVCGFVSLSDIGSPMSISRHIILPNESVAPFNPQGATDEEKIDHDIHSFYTKMEEDDPAEPNKPSEESACVLLHGALKFENLAAVVLLNDDWYGFIHSFSDSKRKSNLILTILPPGNNNIPWLGDFRYFGTADEAVAGENSQFPIKPEKRSYSQNCVVWIKQAGLQSDIQKLLRHAKKLPEKTQQFYKELNRIRRAALSLGFVELLEALSTLFEREILSLSQNVSPDCGIQLKHSAIELRKIQNRDLKVTLSPMPTKYNQLV